MGSNKKIDKFVGIINDLIISETKPLRSDTWMISQLHEERRKLWNEMTDFERYITRMKLGKNANRI